MGIVSSDHLDERRQSFAVYMCNLPWEQVVNILHKQKTEAGRNRLLKDYYKAKAKQVSAWPEEIKRCYMRQIQQSNPWVWAEINNQLEKIGGQCEHQGN